MAYIYYRYFIELVFVFFSIIYQKRNQAEVDIIENFAQFASVSRCVTILLSASGVLVNLKNIQLAYKEFATEGSVLDIPAVQVQQEP